MEILEESSRGKDVKHFQYDAGIMSRNDVFKIVKEVVADKLGIEEKLVIEEAIFIGDPAAHPPGLGADSLYLVDIIMELENVFKMRVEDEDLEKIKTVRDAVNYIFNKLESI